MRQWLLLLFALVLGAPLAAQDLGKVHVSVARVRWTVVDLNLRNRRELVKLLEADPRYAKLCPAGTHKQINDTTAVTLPGDDFWFLSRRLTGQGSYWTSLALDNPQIKIRDDSDGREYAELQVCQPIKIGQLLRNAGIERPRATQLELSLPDSGWIRIGDRIPLVAMVYNQWGDHMNDQAALTWRVQPARLGTIREGVLTVNRHGDGLLVARYGELMATAPIKAGEPRTVLEWLALLMVIPLSGVVSWLLTRHTLPRSRLSGLPPVEITPDMVEDWDGEQHRGRAPEAAAPSGVVMLTIEKPLPVQTARSHDFALADPHADVEARIARETGGPGRAMRPVNSWPAMDRRVPAGGVIGADDVDWES